MIDTIRIQELRSEIGDEDLAFIVSVYIDEARATLDQVASGLSHDEYARAVHFLRSGALNIGLRGIATLAGQLENDLSENPTLTHTLCTTQLTEALDRTMAELETSLP
jgi:HPt (histidine-containing phosphotransfer) domain-containing protein